uniref:ATP synthase complex subunit 8 n=1 Tax=Parastratiosphecomyia szechuanensis TaxID=2783694 RepID=A0A7S6VGS8_9DIPT|nr:ATP synthase F0 subunit 8 [Parastratiosphecomyia szechuanensis]QOW38323.1 ATP synthase F0 subunit 8 [Parastratiosphecomyia szechuanensis]
MPQMAPISWLILFVIFTITFILFNTLNYFCFFNKMPQTPQLINTSTNSMIWKW